MGVRAFSEGWPVRWQLTGSDPLGRGAAAKSGRSARLQPRTSSADQVVKSICPYCAVGCGQDVYVSGEKVVQIEDDPDSPVSRGRLCPKGSAPAAHLRQCPAVPVKYRRPYGTEWEHLDLGTAMDMIAAGRSVRCPAQRCWLRRRSPAGASSRPGRPRPVIPSTR